MELHRILEFMAFLLNLPDDTVVKYENAQTGKEYYVVPANEFDAMLTILSDMGVVELSDTRPMGDPPFARPVTDPTPIDATPIDDSFWASLKQHLNNS